MWNGNGPRLGPGPFIDSKGPKRFTTRQPVRRMTMVFKPPLMQYVNDSPGAPAWGEVARTSVGETRVLAQFEIFPAARSPRIKQAAARFSRFLVAGGLATALQFAILWALVEFAGARPAAASGAGYLISAVLNYLMNRAFTFRSQTSHMSAAPRFAIMCALGLSLNTALFVLLQSSGLNYLVCQVLTTAGVIVFNYMLASRWVFGAAPGRSKD